MYKYFYFVFLLATAKSFSQTTISGIIKNIDNEPIPYCSIGIKNSEVGAISDQNGNYKIIIPDNINDEVIFSAAGYTEKSQNKNDLVNNNNIVLDYHSITLEELVIDYKKMKEKVIGQKSRPMLTFSKMFDQNLPTVEQGTIFDIYQMTKLKSYSFYIIPSSKFQQITLKLNIYNVENNIPNKTLLDENITYKTTTTGWQKIDLSEYGLIFNNLSQIAVSLQLVDFKPLENTDFVFGISAKKSISKNLLFRYQSQGIWEKSDGVFIANLDIAYLKNNSEEELTSNHDDFSEKDNDTQTLITYYENKERAAKTVYGKNKSGKYIDIGDAKIYYESYVSTGIFLNKFLFYNFTFGINHRGFDYGPLGENHIYKFKKMIGWSNNNKTLTIEVEIDPNKKYQALITSNFRNKKGISLKPYLIEFQTSE